MSQNLKDILSNLTPGIDQETLLRYLHGKLSAQEQHEVEKHLQQDAFEADAAEGLAQVKDEARLQLLLHQLQSDLRKKTAKKKSFKEKLRIKEQPVLWIAVLLILALIVVSFIFVHRLHKG